MKKYWLIFIVGVLIFASSQPVIAAANPLAPLRGMNAQAVIPGQYIVVYKSGAQLNSTSLTAQDVASLGGKLLFQYDAALTGFAAVLPDAAVNRLRQDPNVDYIEADQVVTIDSTQSPATWGIDRIDQRNLPLSNSYTYSNTGLNVTVYVIDTGILYSHSEFGGRASKGYDALGGDGSDCNGHGTHVSGTIGGSTYGVAKGVTLKSVRVLNCSGSGTWSGVVAGVNWVTANHASPAVANMSLGGGISSAVDQAVANSIASGVTYAIAAGNSNRDACKFSPARVPAALTVGATTKTDNRASYSNFGQCLDIFAPGSGITSAWYSGDTDTNTISGTSMATPHVAGVAALYLQANSGASPATVASAITNGATSGVVIKAGRGSPNLLLYSLVP